jgi:hypothetical protein
LQPTDGESAFTGIVAFPRRHFEPSTTLNTPNPE